MSNLKIAIGFLIFFAFLLFMFNAVADSEIVDEDYAKCIPSLDNLGIIILDTLLGKEPCGSAPWIWLIFVIPILIGLIIWVTPVIGN